MASEPVIDARRTAQTMHDTAEALERAEQTLHRSADASPDDATAERLDRFGDAVTAEARDIARRADNLSPRPRQSPGGRFTWVRDVRAPPTSGRVMPIGTRLRPTGYQCRSDG
jgi:hypothetical protein